MIIFRYLSREIFANMVAITLILLLIFLSNQFVHYLYRAAEGKFAGGLLLKFMAFQIPYLLGILLPLGFYLGILIAYGRMYLDSEMSVLSACGLSRLRLLGYTLLMALVVAMVVAVITFWISPMVLAGKNKLRQQARDNLLQTLLPGRFEAVDGGRRVFYVEKLSRDRKRAENIFMAFESPDPRPQQFKQTTDTKDKPEKLSRWGVMSAASGYQYLDKRGHAYVVAEDGYRYFGTAGDKQYRTVKFGEYGMAVPDMDNKNQKFNTNSLPMSQLYVHHHETPLLEAEWQWRLSLPLSVFLTTILVVPLCRISARHGKFTQFIPPVLVYLLYVNMMFVGRLWTERHILSLWWIHGAFLALGLAIWVYQTGLRRSVKLLVPGKRVVA